MYHRWIRWDGSSSSNIQLQIRIRLDLSASLSTRSKKQRAQNIIATWNIDDNYTATKNILSISRLLAKSFSTVVPESKNNQSRLHWRIPLKSIWPRPMSAQFRVFIPDEKCKVPTDIASSLTNSESLVFAMDRMHQTSYKIYMYKVAYREWKLEKHDDRSWRWTFKWFPNHSKLRI